MFRNRWSVVLIAAAGGTVLAAPAAKPLKVSAPAAVARALRQDFGAVVEGGAGGQIDWTGGVVTATGTARVQGKGAQAVAMARRASRLVAARNAALLLAGVRAGPGGRLANVKAGQIDVDALLANFTQVRQAHDLKAGTITTTITMPLHGVRGVATFTGVTFAKSDKRWDWPAGKAVAGRADVVILDARGSRFAPSIAPRITDPLGRAVFEGGDLESSRVRTQPTAAYVGFQPSITGGTRSSSSPYTDMKSRARAAADMANRLAREREKLYREAQRTRPPRRPQKTKPPEPKTLHTVARKRFGNPLILQADAGAKTSFQTLVLSGAAASALARHPEAKTLFQTGRVVIVVDRIPAQK